MTDVPLRWCDPAMPSDVTPIMRQASGIWEGAQDQGGHLRGPKNDKACAAPQSKAHDAVSRRRS